MTDAPDMKSAALWYARHGLPVFPLHAPRGTSCSCGNTQCEDIGKHPRTEHGFKDASCDTSRITEWWDRWPDANIGMPTGSASGLVVLDIDPRNGGEESWDEIRSAYPPTAEQLTGGGGRHIAFAHMPGATHKTLAPGIDIKGEGGYVVTAPSLHASGRRYVWDGELGAKALLQPAVLPEWLHERIFKKNGDRGHVSFDDNNKWLPGERNIKLASLAGSMRRRGCSPQAIKAALLEENRLRCDPPLPEREVQSIADSIGRYDPAEGTGPVEAGPAWPKPEPIREALPPVLPFDAELLPFAMRPLALDIAERMQVPVDYPAAVMVLALAGAVNRRARIQPKTFDSAWNVIPNLWGGIVAPPGFMKSPVIQAATGALKQIQDEWLIEHSLAQETYNLEAEEFDLRRAAWKEQFKASAKRGSGAPDRPDGEPVPPVRRRLIVNDATFEALHQTMSENQAGILAICDELTGWWSRTERPGREGERAFFLQAWNGDTSYTVDRIGRGTVHVPACCMSMLGGIQPGKLRS